MKDLRKLAIAAICIGLVSLIIGIIGKFLSTNILGFSPRGFGDFTAIFFLLSINLLLLDKKS